MNLDEFVEKYGLLQDEGGRYYWIDEKKKRREPYCTMLALSLMLNISVPAIKKRIKNLRQTFVKNYRHRIVNAYNLNEVIALCSDLLKESMDGTLFVTNKNGIAIVGSKKYTYLKKLAKLFNVSQSLLEKCVKDKNLPFIMAKIPGGRIIEAYEIRAVEKNCIEIITLPNTNDQGVAIIDGEGYTTIYALTKILNLHYSVIKKFITDNDIESKKIRVAKGQVREGYSIKKVKKACRERRKDHPIVNAQGFAFIDGEKYANITTLSREIKIDLRVLSLRVKKKQLKPIKIRRTASCLDDGYHVKAVEKICGDLLIEYPLVDSSGIAIIDGEKYTTISKLTTILSCSQSKVEEIIEFYQVTPKRIKYPKGAKFNAYNISKMIKLKQEWEKARPTAKEGVIIIDEEEYSSITILSNLFQISRSTVKEKMHEYESKKISSSGGRRIIFYKTKDAFNALSVFKRAPQADQYGNILIDGEKYSSISSLISQLHLSIMTIKKRLTDVDEKIVKSYKGKKLKVYHLEQASAACSDLIGKNLLLPDKNGWAIKNEERYAPISLIARALGVARKSIHERIEHLTPVKGKSRNFTRIDYYNFNQVKKSCADLINQGLLIPDEDNWAYRNDKRYATIDKISRTLRLNASIIKAKIKKIPAVNGKTKTGNPIKYYDFEKVKQSCAKELGKRKQPLLYANKEGVANKAGEIYAPIRILSRELGITEGTIKSRIKNLKFLEGVARNGIITKFYNLREAQKACSDLLEKKRRKNK